jgi:hypothetical protein
MVHISGFRPPMSSFFDCCDSFPAGMRLRQSNQRPSPKYAGGNHEHSDKQQPDHHYRNRLWDSAHSAACGTIPDHNKQQRNYHSHGFAERPESRFVRIDCHQSQYEPSGLPLRRRWRRGTAGSDYWGNGTCWTARTDWTKGTSRSKHWSYRGFFGCP